MTISKFKNGDRVTAPTLDPDPINESALYIGPYPSHPDFYSWVQVGGVARVVPTVLLALAPETVEVTAILTEEEARAFGMAWKGSIGPAGSYHAAGAKLGDACRKALSDD